MNKMIKKIITSILAITMVLSSNMIAFAATAPVECDIKNGRTTLQDYVDKYNDSNATSYTVSDAKQITRGEDCNLVLLNPGENEEGCFWVCYNHGFEMTSSPSHESEPGSIIFMHTSGTPCEYCGWGEEESPVDLSIFSNKCFYGHKEGTPVPGIIMTDYNAADKKVTVEFGFGSTASENHTFDASDFTEKADGSLEFSFKNDGGFVFKLTASINEGQVSGIAINNDGDYDVICDTLVLSTNVKDDTDFVNELKNKVEPFYNYAMIEEEETFDFSCEYVDGTFVVSTIFRDYNLVPTGKIAKVSNDKYIVFTNSASSSGGFAIVEITVGTNGKISKINYSGYVMEVAEKPKVIKEVNLLLQTPVAIGKKAKDLKLNTDTNNLEVVDFTVLNEEYNLMDDDDVFESGKQYELHVTFKALNDYYFTKAIMLRMAPMHNALVKINGVLDSYNAWSGVYGYEYDATNHKIGANSSENKESNIYGEIVYTFTPDIAPDAELKQDATIDLPVADEVVNITPDVKNNDLSAQLSYTNLKEALGLTGPERTNGVWAWMELKAKEVNSSDVPAADKTLIADGLNGKTLGTYLDISIFKQVAGQSKTKMNQKLNEKVTISVTVPSSLRAKGKDFAIVYTHDGGAAKTILPESYNETTGELVFKADEFSTYALVYTPKSVTPTPKPTPTPTPTIPYKAPNTGVR